MRKIIFVFFIISFAPLPVFAQSNQTESLTLTTYFPAPHGVFNRLQTKRLAMGDRNGDGVLNDADQPPNDYQLYIGRSVIYQPLNPFPTAGTPGELAYNASADAFYYYNASGAWVPLGGGSAGGCYASFNISCLSGFTKKRSLGLWGACYQDPDYTYAGGTSLPGSGCPPKSAATWPWNDPDWPEKYSTPFTFQLQGEAFLCCQ